jgi:hypothetical protein
MPTRRTRRAPSVAFAKPLQKAAELSLAAPQVIALRNLMMMTSGTSAGTSREMTRMGMEKLEAWQESVAAMTAQMQRTQQEWALAAMRQWWSAWAAPWQMFGASTAPRALPSANQVQRAVSRVLDTGLAPVHRRAQANAKRLSRRKR